MSVERVRTAQETLGIPWTYAAQELHAGLTPEALADAAAHWERRVAEVAAETAEAARDVRRAPGTGGGTWRKRKHLEDESYLGGDNHVDQTNE